MLLLLTLTLYATLSLALPYPLNSTNWPTWHVDPRQAPNPSYPGDPFSQTASYNLTAFLLPINKSIASHLSGGRNLLPVVGLPDVLLQPDEHPLVFVTGLLFDIRQGPLSIQQLLSANAYIPFVDALNDGQTPYTFDALNLQDKIVPVIAGSLQQSINLQLANFDPPDAAWKDLDAAQYAQDINQGIPKEGNIGGLPVTNTPTFSAVWNPVTPGLYDPAQEWYKGVLNAPYIHTYSGLCSKTTFDFDQAFAQPFFVQADVTAYPPVLPQTTVFKAVQGWHVAAGWDNEFGPGKVCNEYKDFAAAVRYQ